MTPDRIKAIREALTDDQAHVAIADKMPASSLSLADETRKESAARLGVVARNELPGLLDELEEAIGSLSSLSSYLGAGIGDDSVSLKQYVERVEWGLEDSEKSFQTLMTAKESKLESLRADIKAAQRRMHDAGYKSAAAMLNGIVRGEKSTG